MTVVLEGRGLVRRFGDVVAVGGVDVTVAAGEVVGLLGPNGAGKSTTFRILAGLERPDAGAVRLLGVDVTSWPLHRRARGGLGYLPQHPSLLPRLTASENVAVALASVGKPASEARDRLEKEGLAHRAGALASTLSGGERRRVEIARCLALAPRVVLLDEPFAGIDPAAVRGLQDRIRALANEGLAVLLTDHQVREALPICDRAVLLDGGIAQVSGTPAEVAADQRARARYLGQDFTLDPRPGGLQGGRGVYNGDTVRRASESQEDS